MNNRYRYGGAATLLMALLLFCGEASGQSYPERRRIRAGNRDYESLRYGNSEEDYRRAIEMNPFSYEANFNLADALYKQEMFEEAEEVLGSLLENPNLTPEQLAKVHYNIGNSLFSRDKLQEALESYKSSLRANPYDLEAKFNLAYVQKLLEEQQNDGGGEGGDQNDDNQNNDSDREGNDKSSGDQENDPQGDDPNDDQNKEQNQGDQDNGDKQDNTKDQPDKPEPGEQEQREGQMKREDADKMLEAIQQQEDKTREKVNEQRAATVGRSGKNW